MQTLSVGFIYTKYSEENLFVNIKVKLTLVWKSNVNYKPFQLIKSFTFSFLFPKVFLGITYITIFSASGNILWEDSGHFLCQKSPSQTFELSSKRKAAHLIKKVIFVKEEKLKYILQLFYCIKSNSRKLNRRTQYCECNGWHMNYTATGIMIF